MIDSKTSLYAVLGDPVSHSLSPVMHNSAFANTGYNGVYLAFNVKDRNLASAISGIKALGIKGASITIPHKVAVMEFLDELDEKALKIGAVNTIVNRDGKLFGYNTDCLGATNALLEKTDIKNKDVVILGSGGAARATGFGIVSEGGRLTILGVLKDEGENLAKDLGVNYYHLSEFGKIDCSILINATPVGMTPDTKAMPIERQDLNKEMVVMDIVYNPIKTRLLKEAEDLGCITVDGASMFVYQGVAQFEMWTGKKAPVDIMRTTVLNALGKSTA
ncbi:MAG: shikimate dehydrogenase [Desulfobacterales bacterium]|nr:shikimate dehydrogenase [Desulfobacterales bacterium]